MSDQTTNTYDIEALHRALTESTNDIIFSLDLDGFVKFTNTTGAKIFGKDKPDDIIGKQIFDLFPKENAERQWDNIKKVVQSGIEAYHENPTIIQGKTIWLGTRLIPIKDQDGTVTSVLGSSRDITDRKKIEQDLKNSELKYREIIEQSPFSTMIFDPEGNVLSANKAASIMWQASDDQTKKVVERYNILKDEQMEKNGLLPYIKKGFAGEFSEIPAIYYQHDQTKSVSGLGLKPRWVIGYIWPIKDPDGKILQVILMQEDVTTSKENAQKITDSEERLRTIFNVLPVGVAQLDHNRNIVLTNSALERILELTQEELLNGKYRTRKYLRPDGSPMPESELPTIKAALDPQNIYSSEIGVVNERGKIIWTKVTAAGIPGDGVVSATMDITKQKHIEHDLASANDKILSLQKTKNEFISIAAHQLKAPISTIAGFSELFLTESKGSLTEKQKESVETIEKSAKNMNELVNFLLKITRVESGKLKLEISPVNLREITETVVEILSGELDTKNQTVEITQDPDPLPHVFMDKEMLKQIIMNLLSNSSRYSPKNSVINVSMTLKDGEVLYSVSDPGIGIPKDAHSKIFERFFRADNARATVSEGTGLGLALVKSLVDVWGGKIWFESEENKGATFYFTMPITAEKEAVKNPSI